MTLKNMALLIFSVIVCLGLAEAVVRFIYPEYGFPVYKTKLFTEFDPRLGWHKIPNFQGEHIQKEYRVIEKFNSKGLRGPEMSYARTAHVPRVLFIGDSFTEGFAVEFKDVVTEAAKRSLEQNLKQKVEVINAGTGGYSTDQELMFYEDEGRKYSPDVTVLIFFRNDPPFNIRSNYSVLHRGDKPLFEVVDGELKLKSLPEKKWDRDSESAEDLARHKIQNTFIPWDPSSWFLLRLIRHSFHAYELLQTDDYIDADEAYPDDIRHPDEVTRKKEMEMTEVLLAKLNAEVTGDGGKLFIFYAPSRNEVYDHQGKIRKHKSDLEEEIAAMAERHGIGFIPATRVFQNQSKLLEKDSQLTYWKKDGHWTALGNQVAGSLIAEKIQKSLVASDKSSEAGQSHGHE